MLPDDEELEPVAAPEELLLEEPGPIPPLEEDDWPPDEEDEDELLPDAVPAPLASLPPQAVKKVAVNKTATSRLLKTFPLTVMVFTLQRIDIDRTITSPLPTAGGARSGN